MRGKYYLVTGGAGFIGSHLVDALVDSGNRVRVLDDFSSGKPEHLENARRSGKLEVIRGDVRDPATVQQAVAGTDGVFHLAALVSVQQSIAEPRRSHDINAGGAFNVLEAVRRAGVGRVVLASSAAVYGDGSVPAREGLTPACPLSPYALDKLVAEQYAGLYGRLYGLETVALRYFNVYGRRQDPASPYSGAITVFTDRLRHNATVTVYGNGEQTRDFVHVADVVRANLAAMTASHTGFSAYNVGTGNAVSIKRTLEILAGIIGKPPVVEWLPERPGDIRHSCADLRLIHEALGYAPTLDLATGLRELVTV